MTLQEVEEILGGRARIEGRTAKYVWQYFASTGRSFDEQMFTPEGSTSPPERRLNEFPNDIEVDRAWYSDETTVVVNFRNGKVESYSCDPRRSVMSFRRCLHGSAVFSDRSRDRR
jgi:hypothetical protein